MLSGRYIDTKPYLSSHSAMDRLLSGMFAGVSIATLGAAAPLFATINDIGKVAEATKEAEVFASSATKFGLKTKETIKDLADSVKRIARNEIGAVGDVEKLIESSAELGNKADFLLGKATGSVHNIERSQSMLKQFEAIGLFDNPETRAIVKDNLIRTLKDQTSVAKSLENGRVLRESLISGPRGHLKIESIWDGNKLITVIVKG